MVDVSAHDYEHLLDLSIALLDGLESDAPLVLLTETLRTALRADIGVCLHVGWTDFNVTLMAGAPLSLSSTSVELLGPQCLPEYPLARHYAATGDLTPLTSNQVDGGDAFARTKAYALWRSELGVVSQLAIPLLSVRGMFRGFVLGRAAGYFTDREVAVARRLQPVVVRLDRHLRELQRLRTVAPLAVCRPPGEPARCGITPRESTVLLLLGEGPSRPTPSVVV